METLQRETVNNEMQKFKMSVTGSYSNDAMLRQIFEGARIDKVPKCSLIQSKNEWNYLGVPRSRSTIAFHARSSHMTAQSL